MTSSHPHVMRVLGSLIQESRERMLEEFEDGLRPSTLRVIDAVPKDGISITDLAERLAMTKQGVGQFVSRLVRSGHLATGSDPADRRRRVVQRTDLGEAAMQRMSQVLADLEGDWSERVGIDVYERFRETLDALAR